MFGLFSSSVKLSNNIKSIKSVMRNRLFPFNVINAKNKSTNRFEYHSKLSESFYNKAFKFYGENSILINNKLSRSKKDFTVIQKFSFSNYNYNFKSKRNTSENNFSSTNNNNSNNSSGNRYNNINYSRSIGNNTHYTDKRSNYNHKANQDSDFSKEDIRNNNFSASSYSRTKSNHSRNSSYNDNTNNFDNNSYNNSFEKEEKKKINYSNNKYNNSNNNSFNNLDNRFNSNQASKKGELSAIPNPTAPDTNFSTYDFTRSKYYIEKNIPETFQSKAEKLDLTLKDPNIKRLVKDQQAALSFKQMNFLEEIYLILDKLEINSPTSIQNIAIPKILEKKNIFFASQTGMGKTLAYVLPVINELKLQELQLGQRLTRSKRPKVLILAPSRELCQQIEEVIKLFVFDLPLVVESFYVGKPFGTEKKYAAKGVDILISTPDRFKNHWGKNNVFITGITHLIIDELDTFLDAGYAEFIYDLSRKLMKKNGLAAGAEGGRAESPLGELGNGEANEEFAFNVNYEEKRKRTTSNNSGSYNFVDKKDEKYDQANSDLYNPNDAVSMNADSNNNNNKNEFLNEVEKSNSKKTNSTNENISFTTITSKNTKAVSSLLLPEKSKAANTNTEQTQQTQKTQLIYASTTLTKNIEKFLDTIFHEELSNPLKNHSGEGNFVKIIDKSTNHNLSNIKHEFLQVTDYDKYPTLLKILNDNKKILKQNYSIILFVNSIDCARKTEMFLAENGYETCCLHGEIPPLRRKFELEKFKKRKAKVLVTTDLIARGLDFPFVYLVVNFDFPGSVSDYIHRAGRTGRAGRKGFVISFFRKYNSELIDAIKRSNENNTPLQTEGSMFAKNNKEDLALYRAGRLKRLTYGLRDKSLKLNGKGSSEGEKANLLSKIKLRKERIDKMKVQMLKEKKIRTRILDVKYNRKNRDTNKRNTYGNRFAKINKK